MSQLVANSSSIGAAVDEAASVVVANAATAPAVDVIDIAGNIADIKAKISAAAVAAGRGPADVALVAVSKYKTVEDIQACYDTGQRIFGENYFQELLEKAQSSVLPADIQWHFIGHLQTSKVNKLVREVPNLAAVETVDSVKLAEKLDAACVLARRGVSGSSNAATGEAAEWPPLGVYIQVKTSDEDSKSGVSAVAPGVVDAVDASSDIATAAVRTGANDRSELEVLVDYIRTSCPHLRLQGLMTIGAPNDNGSSFHQLREIRDRLYERDQGLTAVSNSLDGVSLSGSTVAASKLKLKLSMGMSSDFETAIERGADIVRVGSSIFGSRKVK